MKKIYQRITAILSSAAFVLSLSMAVVPKSVKASEANAQSIKALAKKAIAQKIQSTNLKSTKNKFNTLNENAALNNSKAKGSVRVIIQLENKPAIENPAKTVKNIKDSQTSIIKKIESITHKSPKKSFGYLVNGFSMNVKRSDIDKIRNIKGVKNVTEARVYHPDMEFAKNLTQVYSEWKDCGYKGEGMVIAVLDTGIDYNHKDMKITNTSKEKLHKSDIKDLGGKGKFFTDKVPYGYNFADENSNVIDENKIEQHGMHVSGIIAANGNDEDSKALKAIQGVAPEAQLLAMKVFSNNPDNETNCYDDDVISAIEDSVLHKADVINISFGSTSGFQDPDDPEQKAIKNATDKGTLVVTSAGNESISTTDSGWNSPQTNLLKTIDTGTVGSPSVSDDCLSVASCENSDKTVCTLNYSSEKGNGTLNYITASGVPEISLKDNHVLVDCNLGQENDFAGKELSNKIALVERGTNTFSEKFLNAQNAGANGVIIYDKALEDGGSNDPLGSIDVDSSITIPVIGIGHSDGLNLKALTSNSTVNINVPGIMTSIPNNLSNDMSPFTSFGTTPSLGFKPDLTAPGGNIYSTQNNNKYATFSGTSMASPNIAGSEALILESLKNKNIKVSGRNLLNIAKNTAINTCKVLYDKSNGNVPFSPRRQGAGLIQVNDAVKNNVIITDKNGKADTALKEIKKNTTFNLTLKNYGNSDSVYSLANGGVLSEKIKDSSGHFSDYSIDGSSMNFSSNTVTVPKNGEAKVSVSINLPSSFEKDKYVEGYVDFKSTSSAPSLVVPYIGFYGSWSDEEILDKPAWDNNSLLGEEGLVSSVSGRLHYLGTVNGSIDPDKIAFSPNNDDIYDTCTPVLSFLRDAKTVKTDIVDKNDGSGKSLRTLFSESEVTKDTLDRQDGDGGAKLYSNASWDGKIYNPKTGKLETAKDGRYYYKITTDVDLPDAKDQLLYLPVQVDTTAPIINITSSEKSDDEGKYKVTFKESDAGSGIDRNLNCVFLNGEEKDSSTYPITYDKSSDTYSCTIPLDKNTMNDIAVAASDYAGNISVSDIAVNSPVIFYNLTGNDVIGKNSLNQDGSFKIIGKIYKNVKSLVINNKNASISSGGLFEVSVPLSEGLNALKISAYDENGNTINFNNTYNIKLLTKNPVITINSPVFDSSNSFFTNQNTVTISGNAAFEDVSPYNKIKVNDVLLPCNCFDYNTGDFNFTIPVSGNTPLTISAADEAANSSSEDLTLIGENSSPLVVTLNNLSGFNTMSSSDIKNDTLTIKGNVNHKPKILKINDIAVTVKDDLTFSQDFKLNQGINKFLVYAEDTDGKIACNYAYEVQYDSKLPEFSLSEPKLQDGKLYTNKDSIELKGSVRDNTYGYTMYINGNCVISTDTYPEEGVSKLFDYYVPVKNNDIITVKIVDKFGNAYNKQIPVVVIKSAPQAPKINLSTTSPTNKDVSVTISSDSNDISEIEYSFDKSKWMQYTKPFTVSSNTEIYAKATDKAGNISYISNASVKNIYKKAPVISISQVEDGKTYYNNITPSINVSSMLHVNTSVTLDGKPYDGKTVFVFGNHTLSVNALDEAGNLSNRTINFTLVSNIVITDENQSSLSSTITDYVNNVFNAKSGQTINIDLSSCSNPFIPRSVLDNIKGKDINLCFKVKCKNNINSILWAINGKDIAGDTKDIILSMNDTCENEDAIKAKDKNSLIISFNKANNTIPGKFEITLNSDWLQNKDSVFLYHYNPVSNAAEPVNYTNNNDGTITFSITSCSDYFLSIKDLSSNNVNNGSNQNGESTTPKSGNTAKTAANSALLPKTGFIMDFDMLMLLGIASSILGVIILKFKGKKN